MPTRHVYSLDLSTLDRLCAPAANADLSLAIAHHIDVEVLAELMLDAYHGTIDDNGETLEDALMEVQTYLSGQRGVVPLLDDSHMAFMERSMVGVCLVGEWSEKQRPLITYIMTRSECKGQGIGQHVLWATLCRLAEHGYLEVLAVITDGNTASERLFTRMGFVRAKDV
ncbi:MAG: GNAT family N-acetyltransferase [Chloroflexota bacterium]